MQQRGIMNHENTNIVNNGTLQVSLQGTYKAIEDVYNGPWTRIFMPKPIPTLKDYSVTIS